MKILINLGVMLLALVMGCGSQAVYFPQDVPDADLSEQPTVDGGLVINDSSKPSDSVPIMDSGNQTVVDSGTPVDSGKPTKDASVCDHTKCHTACTHTKATCDNKCDCDDACETDVDTCKTKCEHTEWCGETRLECLNKCECDFDKCKSKRSACHTECSCATTQCVTTCDNGPCDCSNQ